MNPSILFCIACGFFAAAFAWSAAYNRGYEKGKAVGWLEHHDQCHARNMARRQRNGQFKAKEDKAL